MRTSPRRRSALRLHQLEDRAVPTTYTWDGGPTGTGTDWRTAANWNPDGVPTVADDCVINAAAGNITVAGNAAARTVTVNAAASIRLTAGTFTLGAGNSQFYDLVLEGGTLDPQSGVVLTGNTRVDGPGTLTVPAGRTLTLRGAILNAPVTVQGTLVAVDGSNFITGTLTTVAGSVIRLPGTASASSLYIGQSWTNNGLVEFAAGSAAPTDYLQMADGALLTNGPGGTISCPAAAGPGGRTLTAYVNNQGTISVGAGAALYLSGLTNLANNALSGGTYTLAGTLNVYDAQWAVVNAANLTLDGPAARLITGADTNLLRKFTTVAAGRSLTLRNGAAFTAPAPFANAGTVTLGPGGTLTAGVTTNWAATVIGFSSQYSVLGNSAAEALGTPDRGGDVTWAWTAQSATNGLQTLTVGFSVPAFASGAIVHEYNGALTRVEALDTSNVYHTVWQGIDPGLPNVLYSFTPTWPPTAYLVKGLRLTIDTNRYANLFEEVDAVALVGAAPTVAGYTQTGGTTLLVGGTLSGPANIVGGFATGNGIVGGGLTVSGGQLTPGGSGAGTVTSNGNFALPAGGTLAVDVLGPAAGTQYDQLHVTGTVSLGGTLALSAPFTPAAAASFVIIDNDGIDAVTGTFAGLPQAAMLTVGGTTYQISYAGGTGNDVVLTVTAAAPPRVNATAVNGGAAQRSRATDLSVTFSAPVSFAGTPGAAFTMTRISDSAAVTFTASASVIGSVTVVTLNNFTGSATNFGSLADGRYTLTALASQISANGQPLDGNGDGTPGDNYTFGDTQGLFRFFGDANGDRHVDIADFALFSGTFNLSTGQTGFLAYFDFNNDGRIDIADFGQFSIRFFTLLP